MRESAGFAVKPPLCYHDRQPGLDHDATRGRVISGPGEGAVAPLGFAEEVRP